MWLVSPRTSEGGLSVQVWAEAADRPLCPFDSASLDTFNIQVNEEETTFKLHSD